MAMASSSKAAAATLGSLLLLSATTTVVQSQATVTAVPSSNNHLHAEQTTDQLTSASGGLFVVTANVPVTISRYNDDKYVDGEQPLTPYDAKVIVTSSCDTSETDVVPTLTWDFSTGGAINVELNGVSNGGSMAFLQPASYSAEWTWNNFACDIYPTPAPFALSEISIPPTIVPLVTVTDNTGEEQSLNDFNQQKDNEGSSEDGIPFDETEYKAKNAAVSMRSLPFQIATSLFMGVLNTEAKPVFNRQLQDTCTYNVEVLLDGCVHPVEINAPKARVVDALVVNSVSSKGTGDDPCNYEYSADITFPVTENTQILDMSSGTVEIEPLAYSECIRPVDGRPFVDVSGKGLQSMPLVVESCEGVGSVSWAGEVTLDKEVESFTKNGNSTSHEQLALGEEWTQRALGEHASVASFSAFSIALMTNHAPSNLVEDALRAGLDEVRHARTSFNIASKLIGKDVSPGPLPASTHEFGHDMTSLALAVAREGCVDETLSALVAALEAENEQKYSIVDASVATWIKKELRIIAMDESNHSALAWRTLFWVCSVDAEACGVVKTEVLGAMNLESRFNHRFASMLAEKPASLAAMNTEWKRIYETLASLGPDSSNLEMRSAVCTGTEEVEETSILSQLTRSILRGVLCDAYAIRGIAV
jgi:hypothetical protein